jgi:N-terminal domain on NACHT_NTPase and P-loop NTPases
MDPVSAIGLASAIISFIDFAQQIVTGVDEIYSSTTGATKENTHIETIISDLDDAAGDLTEISSKTKHGKALNALASQCKKVSEDLLQLLNTLTVSGERTTWKVLKITIRNARKEGKVAKTLARLREYRSQILLQLSLMLRQVVLEAFWMYPC